MGARQIVEQAIVAIQRAHDLRVCQLIQAYTASGPQDNQQMINDLRQLRRDLASDAARLISGIREGS